MTPADIDRAFGDAEDTWPFTVTCEHDDAVDEMHDLLHDQVGIADPEDHLLFRTMQALMKTAPTVFDQGDGLDIRSVFEADGADCTWTCPVCFHEHAEHADPEDFTDPDAERD